jgi:hypothetical protein
VKWALILRGLNLHGHEFAPWLGQPHGTGGRFLALPTQRPDIRFRQELRSREVKIGADYPLVDPNILTVISGGDETSFGGVYRNFLRQMEKTDSSRTDFLVTCPEERGLFTGVRKIPRSDCEGSARFCIFSVIQAQAMFVKWDS